MIDCFDATPRRPDENKLESETVFPAYDFLFLVFVIVGRCAKMAENHFRNPELVFGVLGDIDTIAVVCQVDRSVSGVDFYFEGSDRKCVGFAIRDSLRLTNDMIAHVYHAFIEELV